MCWACHRGAEVRVSDAGERVADYHTLAYTKNCLYETNYFLENKFRSGKRSPGENQFPRTINPAGIFCCDGISIIDFLRLLSDIIRDKYP